MFTLDLSEAGPIISALVGLLSPQAESLKLKINNKKQRFEIYVYDKATNLEIIAQFPIETEETKGVQYFALEPSRLRSLFYKRKKIQLGLTDSTLEYGYPVEGKNITKISGKLETEDYHAKFVFPAELTGLSIPQGLFRYYDLVKLKPVFDSRDMLLYLDYKDSMLQVASADNFHVSLLTATNLKLQSEPLNLVLPFRYLDIARKFTTARHPTIDMVVGDGTYTFKTENVAIVLPSLSQDGAKITLPNIVSHLETTRKNKTVGFYIDFNDLKMFLANAVALREKDKAADILFTVLNKTCTLTIATSHGTVQSEILLKKEVEGKHQLKISCAALEDLLNKAFGDKVLCSFAGKHFVLTCKDDNDVLELTTVEVE